MGLLGCLPRTQEVDRIYGNQKVSYSSHKAFHKHVQLSLSQTHGKPACTSPTLCSWVWPCLFPYAIKYEQERWVVLWASSLLPFPSPVHTNHGNKPRRSLHQVWPQVIVMGKSPYIGLQKKMWVKLFLVEDTEISGFCVTVTNLLYND